MLGADADNGRLRGSALSLSKNSQNDSRTIHLLLRLWVAEGGQERVRSTGDYQKSEVSLKCQGLGNKSSPNSRLRTCSLLLGTFAYLLGIHPGPSGHA
jgi:hypothetical protein